MLVKLRSFRRALLVLFCLIITSLISVNADEMASEQIATDFDKETPSGSLAFEHKQLALLVGGGWGGGTLNFQGKSYPFKISGLKVGGIGYSDLEVTGQVYFLKTLEDFAGTYAKIGIGATPVVGGAVATVENSEGVVLQLEAKTTGVALNLGVGGVTIKFEE